MVNIAGVRNAMASQAAFGCCRQGMTAMNDAPIDWQRIARNPQEDAAFKANMAASDARHKLFLNA